MLCGQRGCFLLLYPTQEEKATPSSPKAKLLNMHFYLTFSRPGFPLLISDHHRCAFCTLEGFSERLVPGEHIVCELFFALSGCKLLNPVRKRHKSSFCPLLGTAWSGAQGLFRQASMVAIRPYTFFSCVPPVFPRFPPVSPFFAPFSPVFPICSPEQDCELFPLCSLLKEIVPECVRQTNLCHQVSLGF